MALDARYVVLPRSAQDLSSDEHLAEAKVRRLKYSQIPRAVRTIQSSNGATDPLSDYLENTPDAKESRLAKLLYAVKTGLVTAVEVRTGRAYTIDRGDAIVTAVPPSSDSKEPEHKRLRALVNKWPSARSPMQLKRQQDVEDKLHATTKAVFGDRVDTMFCVAALVTAPEKRGRGYGTALVAKVTDMAAAQGRSTWLFSSNVANTAFYEHCGFVTVKDIIVGGDDPTWTKPPVVVRLMLYDPSAQEYEWLDQKIGLH